MKTLKALSLSILLVVFCIQLSSAQTTIAEAAPIEGFKGAPKLVLGIVVDQMRADYIARFWNKFSEKGFKRLVNGGFLCENNTINYTQSETGPGHTAIYTGATPSMNGIIGNEWFAREQNKLVYCVDDYSDSLKSIGTETDNGRRSPKNLYTNTITDQLHHATNFQSKTIAISLKDRASILPGGFTANGAYWFDNTNGFFITSSYYMKALPAWMTAFNSRKLPATYMTQSWNTSLPIEQYTESTADDVPYEGKLFEGEAKPIFPHDLSKYKGGDYAPLLKTPFGNSLLKELAIETIKAEQLGKGKYPDFLAVSFSSTDYVGHLYGINAIELEDTYIKLDKDLGELLDYIEGSLGKENVLIFLSSDHGAGNNIQYSLDHNIPAGSFINKRLADSLNSTLGDLYGVGFYVLKYTGQTVYLNHDLIQEKKLSLIEIQNITAKYMSNFPGVAYVTTANDLMTTDNTLGFGKLIKNGYNPKRSGDVFVTMQPNWMEFKTVGTTHGTPYNYDTHIPLIFYGWKVLHGSYLPDVNITDIAPTLAHLLNIQAPNGCVGKAIPVQLNH